MQQRRPHSRVIAGLLSLAVFVGAALTSSLAQADTGAGPYYAPPSWDRTLPSAGRFMVLTNFASLAVLDRETGLVWEKSPATTTHTWDAARFQCTSRTTGNRKGWRLPSMPELASLIDPSVAAPGPTLPPGHPFQDVQHGNDAYWSATTFANATADAWYVAFANGLVNNASKEITFFVWCVRGGMNADAY
jgi:hypothetical protein